MKQMNNPEATQAQLEAIRLAPTPSVARRLGRGIPFPKIKEIWHPIRLDIMRQIVVAKFADPTLRNMLLATADAYLEEGNRWKDTFWGVCPPNSNVGENHLGRILMEVRDELTRA